MIEVTNLSSITQTESFRVDGLGRARLLVVQCALDRHPEVPKSDQIRDLISQLQELQTEKNAREQEVAILKAFAKSMAKNPDITPGQAETFSDTLFDKILACAETVRGLDEKITRLNQKTNKIQNSKRGAAFTKAVITILADEDGPIQLRLIYREGSGVELYFFRSFPTYRCGQSLLGPSLRLVRNFRRREAISLRLSSLPRQPLAVDRRGLDKCEASPQHVRDRYSQRGDTETR